jgi:hypothetical protein
MEWINHIIMKFLSKYKIRLVDAERTNISLETNIVLINLIYQNYKIKLNYLKKILK